MTRPALCPALCLAAALATGAVAAAAQQARLLPELYRVTGVAAGDALNIRAEPAASAEAIGSFAPDARGIEVVAEEAGWLQVTVDGEGSGWVNGRFLEAEGDSWGAASGWPESLRCVGTEPFWSLVHEGGALVLDEANFGESRHLVSQVTYAIYPPQSRTALSDGLTVAVAPEMCSDGMSDRDYGLTALLIVGRAPDARQLNGCCTLQR